MSFEEQVQRHRRQIVEQREEGAQLADQQRAERASLRAALDDFKTQFAGAVDYLTQQGVPTRAVCAVQRGRGGPALLKVHPYKVIVVGGLFLQGGELYYGTLVRSPVRAVLRGVRKGDVIVEVSPYMGPCDGDFVFLPDHAEPTTGTLGAGEFVRRYLDVHGDSQYARMSSWLPGATAAVLEDPLARA